MLDAKLIVVGGDAKASEIQLRLPTTIGRGREASLTLPHPLVSRMHAEIFEREGKLYVRDIGSLNGTFINNRRIADDEVLGPDELLTLGNVTFRAIYQVVGHLQSDQESAVPAKAVELKKTAGRVATKARFATQPVENATPRDIDKPSAAPARENRGHLETTAPVASAAQSGDDNGLGPRSTKSIDVVSVHDPDLPQADRSVSASSLDDLPSAPSTVDIAGEIVAEEGEIASVSNIDPASLDFEGEDRPQVADPDNSSLGSFLKKLPR